MSTRKRRERRRRRAKGKALQMFPESYNPNLLRECDQKVLQPAILDHLWFSQRNTKFREIA
jgi:hypothetical protein